MSNDSEFDEIVSVSRKRRKQLKFDSSDDEEYANEKGNKSTSENNKEDIEKIVVPKKSKHKRCSAIESSDDEEIDIKEDISTAKSDNNKIFESTSSFDGTSQFKQQKALPEPQKNENENMESDTEVVVPKENRYRSISIAENSDEVIDFAVHRTEVEQHYRNNTDLMRTPIRNSSQLHEKELLTSNKRMPVRNGVLDEISPEKTYSPSINLNSLKLLKTSNNLIKGRSTYNTETIHDLEEDWNSEYDFIDDESEEEEENTKSKKKKKRNTPSSKQKRTKILSSSEESDKETDETDSVFSKKFLKKKKRKSISDEESEVVNEKDSCDTQRWKQRLVLSRNKKKKNSDALQKLRQLRGAKNIPFQQRRPEVGGNASLHESEFNELQEGSSDENFIDDEKDGGNNSSTSDDDHWSNTLQQLLKSFIRSPVVLSSQRKKSGKKSRLQDLASDSDDDIIVQKSCLSDEEQYMYKCVIANDLESVSNILKTSKVGINVQDDNKYTVLHIAAMKGLLPMINVLLKNKANADITDNLGLAPLAYAAIHKFSQCLPLLLEHTNMAIFSKKLNKHLHGCNLLHLILTVVQDKTTSIFENVPDDLESKIVSCINAVKEFNNKMFLRFLSKGDDRRYTPLVLAIDNDLPQAARLLLEAAGEPGQDISIEFPSEEGETFLHFSVQHSTRCFIEVLPYFQDCIDESDCNGFTPLMYACELGKDECIELLLKNGSSIHVKDKDGTSPLHLAAASGNIKSIELLLRYGHEVDCTDKFGWPPLLYANFKAAQSCVVSLFNADPKQIFCLGRLLDNANNEMRRKNAKVIQETLLSISHIDAYYTIFNDFIARNMWLLEENDCGVFTKTWRMILNFQNKVRWLEMKCAPSFYFTSIDVDRANVITSALESFQQHGFDLRRTSVRFKGEPGSCLGPKREFIACLVNDFINVDRGLLTLLDNQQYSLVPSSYFMDNLKKSLEDSLRKNKNMEKVPLELLIDNKIDGCDLTGNKENVVKDYPDVVNDSHNVSLVDDTESNLNMTDSDMLTADLKNTESGVVKTETESWPVTAGITEAGNLQEMSDTDLMTAFNDNSTVYASIVDNITAVDDLKNMKSGVLKTETESWPVTAGIIEAGNSQEMSDTDLMTAFNDSSTFNARIVDNITAVDDLKNMEGGVVKTETGSWPVTAGIIEAGNSQEMSDTDIMTAFNDSSTVNASIVDNNIIKTGNTLDISDADLIVAVNDGSIVDKNKMHHNILNTLDVIDPKEMAVESSLTSTLQLNDHIVRVGNVATVGLLGVVNECTNSDTNTVNNSIINTETIEPSNYSACNVNVFPSNATVGTGNTQDLSDTDLISVVVDAASTSVDNNDPNTIINLQVDSETENMMEHNCNISAPALDVEEEEEPKQKCYEDYCMDLDKRMEMIKLFGQFIAQVILDREINIKMLLSKPLVKQLLGITLNHPDELSEIDHHLYSNIKENEMTGLELPFSVNFVNPWNGDLEEVLLNDGQDEVITDDNKDDYLKLVSIFKYETSISSELSQFKKGFYQTIRHDVIGLFTADEFSLLLNGVYEIDVADWKANTMYFSWKRDSPVIVWFWNTVEMLKDEEKSLLLKFATGSPCVPMGGFKELRGLSGPTLFTIGTAAGLDKLPQASTCFNQLSLPNYSSESELKEKLLIAIRHGCEGFAFSW